MIHTIISPHGVVTPVGIEHAVESVAGIAQAAAVGVGPAGTQQIVVVAVTEQPVRTARLASLELADQVRAVVDIDVAAVLVVPAVPVDKRHNSKIDRTEIARWAEDILAGGRMRRI
jgi:acyl-coenzyme A synthetase/AMP-(fatty) acid ligase